MDIAKWTNIQLKFMQNIISSNTINNTNDINNSNIVFYNNNLLTNLRLYISKDLITIKYIPDNYNNKVISNYVESIKYYLELYINNEEINMDKDRKTILLNIIKNLEYDITDSDDILLQDIGLSSFDQMRFIVEIKEEFDIDIPIEDMDLTNFDTFEKVNEIIQKALVTT